MSFKPQTLRPLGATAISLATVLAWTALLGVVYLPHEIRQLANGQTVYVLNQQFIEDGRREVLLTRRTESGLSGRILWEVMLYKSATVAPSRVLVSASRDPLVMAATGGASRLFVGRAGGEILILDLQAAEPEFVPVGRYPTGDLKGLCCSSSGDVLVAGGTDGICAWNTKERRLSWSRDDVKHVCWAIDARSRELLVETTEGKLLELDLATGRTLRVIRTDPRHAMAMALSADGARLARIGWNGQLEMIDRAGGSPIWIDPLSSRKAPCASNTMKFSPDGQELVAAHPTDQCSFQGWSVNTGRQLRQSRGHSAPISALTFTPDGRWRTWAMDGTVRTWDSWLNDTVGGDRFAGKTAAGNRVARNRASAERVREPAPGAFGVFSFPTRR